MILLLHAIVPHHHHSEKPICFEELTHQIPDNHNDCCNHNGDNNNHNFDENNCIIDDLFTPKNDNEIESYVRMSLQEIFVNLDLFVNTLTYDFILDNEGKIFRRNNLTFNYKNPLAISNVGLRAPPMSIRNA